MKIFYSHSELNEKLGKKQGIKTIKNHTFGVSDKAVKQLSPMVNFRYPFEQLKRIIKTICLFHDLGKYTKYFQKYLLEDNYTNNLKQHARFGAYTIYEYFKEDEKLAFIAYFIVRNHHSNLHFPMDVDDFLISKDRAETLKEDFEKQKESIAPYFLQISSELNLKNIENHLKSPNRKRLYNFLDEWLEDDIEIQNYFLINYMFSLLIEADKLDASNTDLFKSSKIPNQAVDEYISKLNLIENEQNKLRNLVRKEVISHLENPKTLKYFIFLLPAPTGIGKTLTALDFAIRLRNLLPNQPQIITGLPFVNIIEQTIHEYEKVLAPYQVNVLGHYQFANIMKNIENENDHEKNYNQKRMELNTWQADVIVTSFVQLLETMISNKNKALLKFNHFAGAIIVMDEVQSLRLEQVPLIGSVIYYMSKFLGTRFILMTATKPLIFELADKEILTKRFGISSKNQTLCLINKPKELFRKFHRTKIVPLLSKKINTLNDFTPIFHHYWKLNNYTSCILVCNTVNRSILLFRLIESFLAINKLNNPIYYLSTNVLPVERLEIINKIKYDLKSSLNPILVSTQVVEAGVDLNFGIGFRDLGPIDSIVQIAGRINRENNILRKYSPLYIIDFGDCKNIYGLITSIQAKLALGVNEILEPDYYDLVENYFINISNNNIFLESKKLFTGIEELKYNDDNSNKVKDYIPVSDFKVIKSLHNTISVFIELNKNAKEAKSAFLKQFSTKNQIDKKVFKEDYEKYHKRHFKEHTLNIPKYLTEKLPLIDSSNSTIEIKYVSFEEIHVWYDLKVGYKRETIINLNKELTVIL